ncbi:MAG: response regulator [Pirellulales bacterium]
MSAEALEILLAEDDEGHAFLVQRNLERAGVANRIIHVADGQAALDYIRREGPYTNREPDGPLLLVLDINMPRVDGVEVLTRIKSADVTQKLPVIMLTTTDDPREIERCYQLGCNVYITKPVEYNDFVEAVKRLGLLLQVVQVPGEVQVA